MPKGSLQKMGLLTSIDMMEKATQRLQTGLGMRMKLTTIMKAEVTRTDWSV